jgi:hypothetical protein
MDGSDGAAHRVAGAAAAPGHVGTGDGQRGGRQGATDEQRSTSGGKVQAALEGGLRRGGRRREVDTADRDRPSHAGAAAGAGAQMRRLTLQLRCQALAESE